MTYWWSVLPDTQYKCRAFCQFCLLVIWFDLSFMTQCSKTTPLPPPPISMCLQIAWHYYNHSMIIIILCQSLVTVKGGYFPQKTSCLLSVTLMILCSLLPPITSPLYSEFSNFLVEKPGYCDRAPMSSFLATQWLSKDVSWVHSLNWRKFFFSKVCI